MHYLKPKQAKLPLPPDEVARIHGFRDMLESAIHKINHAIDITHADLIEDVAARKAARAAAQAAETQNIPPKPVKNQTRRPRQDQSETPPPDPNPAQDPAPKPRAARGGKPEIALLYLVRAMEACIRLDAWLADRLAGGAHTTAEQAGLYHPDRQPILDYLHKATRFEQPYQFQRTTHDALETRISEELGWAPDRNPADIIVEICTHYKLPYDPNDFPNNWRPSPPANPPPDTWPPPDPEDLEDAAENLYKTIMDAMESRRLDGRDN